MSDATGIEELYELTNLTLDLLTDGVLSTHPRLVDRLAALPGGAAAASPASVHAPFSMVPPSPVVPNPVAVPGATTGGAHDLSHEERLRRLDELASEIRSCRRCPLGEGRTNAVPGVGALDPLVMIVGEGPGAQEDQQGLPFVGRAGQYLDKWLSAIGLDRETNVFIANIVKCRPPNNRDPESTESGACRPYLDEQIALVQPRMILTVGRISMRLLTGSEGRITRIHGTFYSYKGIPLVPTFHPSAVLRNQEYRRPVWEDLKKVRNWLVDNTGHSAPDIP